MSRQTFALLRWALAVGGLMATSTSSCAPVSGAEAGEALFHDPRMSRSEFNVVSCATCHDDGDNSDDGGTSVDGDDAPLLSGAPLTDVVFRPTWWGGQVATLKGAVDACLVSFMRERPLDDGDPRGRAIYEHLLARSRRTATAPVPFTIVENVTTVGRGDPRRGESVWSRACASCHGAPHTGEGRLSELVSVVPEDSVDFATDTGFSLELVLIEKVRHGGFFGVGGSMPPYSLEALSDDDLAALLGYLLDD
jgi:thiosulfate dehydrogenase